MNKLIIRRVVHIDTIGLLMLRPLPPKLFDAIARTSRSARQHRAKQGPLWRLTVHGPDLHLIARLTSGHEARVNELHVAWNFLARSQQEAAQLFAWTVARIVNRRTRRRPGQFAETAYLPLGRKWPQVQLAVYADRPCKATGGPCLHVECRLRGTKMIRRFLLFTRPRDFARHFTFERLWSEVIAICEPNYRTIGRTFGRRVGLHRRKKGHENQHNDEIMRGKRFVAALTTHTSCTAAMLRFHLRRFQLDPARHFLPIACNPNDYVVYIRNFLCRAPPI